MYLTTFRNSLENFGLDPAHFHSGPGLTWQAALKKVTVKFDLLTDIDMLLIVQKGTGGGIGHAIYQYVKANKNI